MTQNDVRSKADPANAPVIQVGSLPSRLIVDENAGPGTPVWEQYHRAVGDGPVEYVFLKETHLGIPDVEILDKLLVRPLKA